ASTRPPSLRRGMDDSKDQSYALFGIARHRLDRMLLPVGGFRKTEIREVAESLGLGVAGKKDSQEICFVTQGHHSDFVRAKEPTRSHGTGGEFVMTDGTVVGTHGGYEAFTVGQRKGLGIAMGRPVFVVRVEPQTRRVVLGDREDLLESGLIAGEANWLVDPHSIPENVHVQIRYNGRAHPARVSIDAADCQRFGVHFEQPESAVAPGQAAVVYDGDRVLGGGWIEAATGGI
ncbi:MAG: aminomethyltransferase beta-barrel domain-containing protein, partial [Planctomycetota bacterium]